MAEPLHARLLELVADPMYSDALSEDVDTIVSVLADALRAVVELHAPETTGPEVWCPECDYASWPCSTIRVIARELGIKDEELIEKESPTNG